MSKKVDEAIEQVEEEIEEVKKTSKKKKTHTVVKGETLGILAHKYSVSWQSIAVKNNIKAPYKLEPGSKIKL